MQYSQPVVNDDGTFSNPFRMQATRSSFSRFLKFIVRERNQHGIPSSKADRDRALPVIKPDMAVLQQPPTDGVRVTWLGHASTLVQLDGISVLTDPIFSERCSPVPFAGPKRYRPPPCSIADLPRIDAVVISHNHYDHLDYSSVRQLNKRFGATLKWFVPLGLKQWFLRECCTNVVELSWWDEQTLSDDSSVPGAHVRFCSVPAQHWSKRTLSDAGRSLWCGWAVIGQNSRFYFAGDTGYCDAFKQIGHRYGPFDFAAIPIGAYAPREIMQLSHINPEEAVLIHQDVRARWSLGIHWGTFPLSSEPYLEPPQLVKESMSATKLDPSRFFILQHGGTRHIEKE